VFLRDRVFGFDEARARIAAVSGEEIQAIARAALEGPACAAALGPKAGHGALAAFQAK
jgi:hypothetical protein